MELTKENINSVKDKAGRLALVVTLMMIPFLLCIGAYSRSQSREPYVYFITGDPDTDKSKRLVMLAAVSSSHSTISLIKGPINTRCQLSGDMKGDVLMVNVSIPRCLQGIFCRKIGITKTAGFRSRYTNIMSWQNIDS